MFSVLQQHLQHFTHSTTHTYNTTHNITHITDTTDDNNTASLQDTTPDPYRLFLAHPVNINNSRVFSTSVGNNPYQHARDYVANYSVRVQLRNIGMRTDERSDAERGGECLHWRWGIFGGRAVLSECTDQRYVY